MDYEQMTAPCGLACFDCIVYLANEDEKLREFLAKEWGTQPEHVGCKGCREIEGHCPVISGKCKVYQCAEKKGVKFCCDCDDFPCDNLLPFADKATQLSHNTKLFNLCLIKKMGLEEWAKNRAKQIKDAYFQGKLEL